MPPAATKLLLEKLVGNAWHAANSMTCRRQIRKFACGATHRRGPFLDQSGEGSLDVILAHDLCEMQSPPEHCDPHKRFGASCVVFRRYQPFASLFLHQRARFTARGSSGPVITLSPSLVLSHLRYCVSDGDSPKSGIRPRTGRITRAYIAPRATLALRMPAHEVTTMRVRYRLHRWASYDACWQPMA